MKLATIRTVRDGGDPAATRAVRLDGDEAVELGDDDVGAVLRRPGWREWAAAADGPRRPVDGLDFAPLVPRPDKIICVGLNYRSHILETGRQPPEHPTLFAKYRRALIGAHDEIVLPAVSDKVDWEAELAVVIGAEARHVTADEAPAHIAGYSVLNDVSVRDFQNRTLQWLQGKTFEATTPIGPWLVTDTDTDGDEPWPRRAISCAVDDELVQEADTADLVFDPPTLVAYVSAIVTLEPGDIIATGTPGGVGHARTPPRFLADGQVVTTRVAGIGELRNRCRKEEL